jgi:hypothetical protein
MQNNPHGNRCIKFCSIFMAALLLALMCCVPAFAHPGRTDQYGGHHDRNNGGYHCRNAGSSGSKASGGSAAGKPRTAAPTAALQTKIAQAKQTHSQQGGYTNASWKNYQTALRAAQKAAANPATSQTQADSALSALNAACAELQPTIFTTQYAQSPWNWFLFFACFGWIWMWFKKA